MVALLGGRGYDDYAGETMTVEWESGGLRAVLLGWTTVALLGGRGQEC